METEMISAQRRNPAMNDIVERLKNLNVATSGAFPSLVETIAELERLQAEVTEWKDRFFAERQDHEATMKAWDEERSKP